MIVATGNLATSGGVTNKMPTPLVSRLEHIKVEPDLDGWITWAATRGCHTSVISFIKARSNLFVQFNPDVPGPFPCPRTWKMVSDVMLAYKDVQPPFESLSGWVGNGPATEFLSHHTMALNLPDVHTIVANPATAPKPTDPGALYALTTMLAAKLTFQTATPFLTYLRRLPIEYAVYCVALQRDIERGIVG
jgi:hypothetical protein